MVVYGLTAPCGVRVGLVAALALATIGLAAPAAAQVVTEIEETTTLWAMPGEFIVQHDGRFSPAEARQRFSRIEHMGVTLLRHNDRTNLSVIKLESGGRFAALADRLGQIESQPGVLRIEPNTILYPTARPVLGNDPQLSKLWLVDAIKARQAWAVHHDASEVVVAVIDTGVFTKHEDLTGNLWINEREIPGNGKDDDGNGYIDDVHGWDFGSGDNDPTPDECRRGVSSHGTHIAGTIGAVGGNAIGISGVAPKIRIMSLKVALGTESLYFCGKMLTSNVLEAVMYALDNGAKIINLSLGNGYPSKISEVIYKLATDNGILIVASAGNDSMSNDGPGIFALMHPLIGTEVAPQYPASYPISGVLSVAATQRPQSHGGPAQLVRAWDKRFKRKYIYHLYWRFRAVNPRFSPAGRLEYDTLESLAPGEFPLGSNFGGRSVHIAAPGKYVYSSVALQAKSGGPLTSGYAFKSGTSMAAPVIAGAAALVWSAFPEMSNVAIKNRLMATVTRSQVLNGKVVSGGQVNLYKALCDNGAPRRLPGCGIAGPATAPVAKKPPPSSRRPVDRPAPPERRRVRARRPALPPVGSTTNLNDLLKK